ncbi:hypothetical protein [Glycomyces algeriensis]|uniref:Uncharacterized protein n=1 Tax=Glycomyces algeriensis TaxID=256037 RepID=A0A9W6GEG1_9ACTN|nr:hypothetical protein [Glycomyces algeriensis]MDA1368607.1 hypothetical protein [Glycomyces algeriensis]MDR7352406.1 hypothetical protein [Glycomyces algeriensis]GLI45143.1 hypothetical protein GALLR39Z86_49930 [Glycomyces algeriensis]
MARKIARIALVAVLMVGVVAMHSWGHRGHGDEPEVETAAAATHHHAGMMHHDTAETDPESDEDPSGLLSLLGFMVCSGVMLRVALELLRPLFDRALTALAVLEATVEAAPARARQWALPAGFRPTSLLLNRIAVLRI